MRSEEEIKSFISSIDRLARLKKDGQDITFDFKGQEIEGEIATAIKNTLEWVLEEQ